MASEMIPVRTAIVFVLGAAIPVSSFASSMISYDNAAFGVVSSITITEDFRITGGDGPSQVAVNSATHTVYVTNPGEQTVTVLKQDGNSSLLCVADMIEVPNAFGIAVNPVTNMIYVSRYTDSSVYAVDGSVNRVISAITVGSAPRGVAVDPSSNKVYVANFASDSVSVIDGTTNKVIHTIEIGEGDVQEGPRGLAIDRETGMLYVTSWLSDSVAIIDTSTNMVVGKVPDVGGNPSAIAVNEETGKVYVAGRNSVSVIGASNGRYELVGNLPIQASETDGSEYRLGGIAVNQETNLVYFTNMVSNSTTVIDGNDDTIVGEIAILASQVPKGVAVDENWDAVYIANQGSNSLMLVDGSSREIKSSIQIGGRPSSVAFNPETNMVYVGNYDAGTVSIMNGTVGNNLVGILAFGQQIMDVKVNDKTNRVYVLISTVEPDGRPKGTVVVIDGNTNSIVDRISIAALAPSSIAVNTETDLLYIGHDGYNHHTITVINGSTNEAASSINTGYNYPEHIAVNEKANKLYVAISEPNIVLMYDLSENGAIGESEPKTVPIPVNGRLSGIAVNPETDMAYVTDYWNGTVSIIDGSSARVVKTLAGFASPTGVAVDAKTNTVYVADNDFDTLVVIDGPSNEIVAELVTDKSPLGVAVNSQSGSVYVTNAESGNVLMYDEPRINASKFRMVPFSLPARVIPAGPSVDVGNTSSNNNTADDQRQDEYDTIILSGRAQDVKVTDIVIKPQESMLVINYTNTDEMDEDDERGMRGGIIEVTLPTSLISEIRQFRLERISQYLQVDDEIVGGDAGGFFIYQGDRYPKNPAPKFAYASSNSTSNTIKFIVPLDGEDSIGIYGEKVLSESGGREDPVEAADGIVVGMVTDKESFDTHEDVWISVYEWLKTGSDDGSGIILRVEGPADGRELDLAIGEEVLLFVEEIDASRGYFGLYRPDSEMPSKYPITLLSSVLSLIREQTPAQTEDEELQRLPDIDRENCMIMEFDAGRDSADKFLYCTYEQEYMRFYVPIPVTLELAKKEMLKHVSEQYFAEHFNLIRASDTAFVNGHAVPVGQNIQFEYTIGNFTFDYSVIAELGHGEDDGHLLYLEYAPPKEITSIALEDRSQIERIIYDSSCLPAGTPYELYDGRVLTHVDRGFSPFIAGRGPPDVFDRHGNQIVESEKRFQLWLDTGEIQCTDNVKIDDEIDDTIGRPQQALLVDASIYLGNRNPESPQVENNYDEGQLIPLVGVGAAIAGIIAFVTLKKRR